MNDFNNPQVAALPGYLRKYIVEQSYEHYTALDQAVWRYVMRQNYSFLKDVAYYPYIPGLKAAGLTIESIPRLQEINDALGEIGWGAVTVDGFIPPAAFMAFQAHRVLVIAAEIRTLEHIEYTPAPDIIHESAGHAPIIADPEYHSYLSYFGEVGTKAMFSSFDFELYEAIRTLSILKEMPGVATEAIREAEENLEQRKANMGEPSEMALLSRLHWWTVEYGLIGSLENPKIYGAGLLSSIEESASCMDPSVKKLWYSIDALNYPYDITSAQPQLFVTKQFSDLQAVLEEFASGMAYRKGGKEGLDKAIECRNVCTAVFSSGIQVSGTFLDYITDEKGDVSFLRTSGPTALSIHDHEIPGQGRDYHKDGFSIVPGRLQGSVKHLEDYTNTDLARAGINEGSVCVLQLSSGIRLQGKLERIHRNDNKLILLVFSDCSISTADGEMLFHPAWGLFDMIIGERIISVFSGPADRDSWDEAPAVSSTKSFQPVYTDQDKAYHDLFEKVRRIREEKFKNEVLEDVFAQILRDHPRDWLCSLEILEILETRRIFPALAAEVRKFLKEKRKLPELSKLVSTGLLLIPVYEGAVPQ